MFFWEHRDGTVELAEGLVRHVHPSGFVVVTADIIADTNNYVKDSQGSIYLKVPLENVIAAKASTPKPAWLGALGF